ncbi:hypothetical protein NQ314_000468 [Rhamnusium bicolor]|uniref:DUF659 domain-containing protein n=1 Tax=Rhamnusium bicolor TaxID=1586634 RepID=A0AAV8ZY25_9CUCU|nr:hypothetical protein NQ314_000468 [Rhamnusium bicolor]
MYNESASRLKAILYDIKHVSVTTDIWSSDSNVANLTLTCHFIHGNELNARVLSTKELTSSHTGENIAATITTILSEWNIFDKIVTIVSDNGINIKNAINEYIYKYHHPCVAHTLNLTNGISNFKSKQDVATRWNSYLLTKEILLETKDPLSIVVINLPKAPEFLDALEWTILRDSVPILKPIELLTSVLSGEKYPIMSLVIPLIRGIQHNLKSIHPQAEEEKHYGKMYLISSVGDLDLSS